MEKSIDKSNIYEWSLYQYIVKRKIIESKGSKKAFHEGFTVDYVCDLELKYQERQPNSVNDLSEAYKCSATTYNNYYRAYKRLRDMNIIEENHVQQHLPIATIHQPQHEANLQSQLLLSAQEITKLKQELKEQERLNLKHTQERELLTRQLEAVKVGPDYTAKLDLINKHILQLDTKMIELSSFRKLPKSIEDLSEKLELHNYYEGLRSELKHEIKQEYTSKLDAALYTRHELSKGIKTIQDKISTLAQEHHNSGYICLEELYNDMKWVQNTLTTMINTLLEAM
ncbi:MAG TPA: hypothetical protein GX731_09385 [Clostridiales bacterium]|nr:hypothetical protein [Clostridiales bacterium]